MSQNSASASSLICFDVSYGDLSTVPLINVLLSPEASPVCPLTVLWELGGGQITNP